MLFYKPLHIPKLCCLYTSNFHNLPNLCLKYHNFIWQCFKKILRTPKKNTCYVSIFFYNSKEDKYMLVNLRKQCFMFQGFVKAGTLYRKELMQS